MAISPNKLERLSIELRRMYESAETELLDKIARRIEKGIDSPNWQENRLAEIRTQRLETEKIIGTLQAEGPKETAALIERAYQEGIKSADSDLISYGISLREVGNRTAQSLIATNLELLEKVHLQIIRRSNDIYREVITQAVENSMLGVETRRQAAQRALNVFANRSIGGFIDSRGRNWDLGSYTEMATRSAIGQASIQGHADRLVDQGRDLVIVSDHADECPLCRPYERQILSISGNDSRYPSLAQAQADGLFHQIWVAS